MAVIRTSTGTAQEIAIADGPMTTAAGSRQTGVAPISYPGATPIPGADTYFYQASAGMQEVASSDILWVLEDGEWDDNGYWLLNEDW